MAQLLVTPAGTLTRETVLLEGIYLPGAILSEIY